MQNQNRKPQVELIVAEWRQVGKELVRPLALRLEGRWLTVVEPIWRDAAWYYIKDAVDVLLYLEKAGDGRRSVRLEICRLPPQLCKAVEEEARAAWIFGLTVRQVEKWLKALELVS